MKDLTNIEKCGIIISEKEKSLLKKLRQISYGQVTIFMQDGIPLRIEVIRESVKL
ncbi:hypothetical protein LCGC14_1868550 [marine sediment metagenome]|uniref:DUF2292 domain-containing protein n=1 Tax=marine sediment metagenome TaxID=412755 RepID=A0A0F9IJQ5_9ZZZZ